MTADTADGGSAMIYRPDIDALRAVAVLLVVLFHAHAPLFTGGFLGVDVFFVISGYLITGIVMSQVDQGAFSLGAFYGSRLRRIVPALAVMVLVVFLVCHGLGLCVDDFASLRRSTRAALFMCANIHFRGATGYFDLPAHSQVFLHTWSLGVEAQFYLVYPVFVSLVYRRWPGRFSAILGGLAACSFVLCEATVHGDPAAAFFLLPSRAWELLAGGVLAATGWSPDSQAGKRALMVGGLVTIGAATAAYGRVVHPTFPGFAALPPVVGALAWIAGGDGLIVRPGLTRVLVHPVTLFVGLVSYSLYLWHWPVLVIARRLSVEPGLPAWATGAALLVGLGLAVVSWRLVEIPSRRWLATRSAGTQAALLAAALVGAWLPSQCFRTPFALTDRQATLAAGATDRSTLASGAVLGPSDRPPRFLLVGDSHAEAVGAAFARAAVAADVPGRLFFGPTLINAYRARADARRAEHERELRRLVETERYDAVFIVRRWTLDVEGYMPTEHPTPALDEIGIVHDDGAVRRTGPAALEAALGDTVAFLERHGVRRVYLLLPIPECRRNIPQAASVASLFHDEAAIDAALGVTDAEYMTRHATSRRILTGIAAAHEVVTLLDPWPIFGRDGRRSRVLDRGRCLYYDDDHLSATGSLVLVPLLLECVPFRPPEHAAPRGRSAGGDVGRPVTRARPR